MHASGDAWAVKEPAGGHLSTIPESELPKFKPVALRCEAALLVGDNQVDGLTTVEELETFALYMLYESFDIGWSHETNAGDVVVDAQR